MHKVIYLRRFIQGSVFIFLGFLTVLSLVIIDIQETLAKVRPSDITEPTDHFGLGRGYAPPGAKFNLDIWGGIGSIADPFVQRSQAGFLFNIHSPFDSGELGVTWGMFSHNYEEVNDVESGVYTTNLALDWRWRGGKKQLHDPFLGIGIALPTRTLSGEGGIEGDAQLDAYNIALASRFGGQKRWLWELNTASVFLETGGRSQWGSFILEGDLGVAYMYRVAESNIIETANLFAQTSARLGFQGSEHGLLIGGGYAIAPLSLAEDFDQIHTQVNYTYIRNESEYFINLFLPIDAPAGLLANQVGMTLIVGTQGQM